MVQQSESMVCIKKEDSSQSSSKPEEDSLLTEEPAESLSSPEEDSLQSVSSSESSHSQRKTSCEQPENYMCEHQQYDWTGSSAFNPLSPWNGLYGFGNGNDMMPFFPNMSMFSSVDVPTTTENATVDASLQAQACACGNILDPSFRFCDQCGAKRQPMRVCSCGHVLILGANFCDQCGAKQSAATPVATGACADQRVQERAAVGKDAANAGIKKSERAKVKVALEESSEELTTMMLRNIPSSCTQDQFYELLETIGFRGMVDFLYVPVDFSNERNFGYAFVNFRTAASATEFKERFDGVEMSKCFPTFHCDAEDSESAGSSNGALQRQRKAKKSNRDEVCKVLPAAIQGWEANMQKLCSSHSTHRIGGPEHWHPLFLDASGERVNVADRYKPATTTKKALNPNASAFVPMPDCARQEDVKSPLPIDMLPPGLAIPAGLNISAALQKPGDDVDEDSTADRRPGDAMLIDVYSTKLDPSVVPLEKRMEAERIAKEMKAQKSPKKIGGDAASKDLEVDDSYTRDPVYIEPISGPFGPKNPLMNVGNADVNDGECFQEILDHWKQLVDTIGTAEGALAGKKFGFDIGLMQQMAKMQAQAGTPCTRWQ